jgi:NodT family efflux transporter outer membrane factor (OMF) lipoprotein
MATSTSTSLGNATDRNSGALPCESKRMASGLAPEEHHSSPKLHEMYRAKHAWRKRLLLLAGAAITTSGLGGCMTVGPNYKAPATEIKPFYSATALAARNGSVKRPAPSLDTWWLGFNDPELTKIVQRAQSQNLDLQASLARVQQARAVAKEAGARRLPSGDLDIQTTSMHQSLLSPIGELASVYPQYQRNETLFDEGVGASWELDLFGGLRRGEEAAIDEAQAAEAEHIGTRISITADAADAYFQVRGDQERLKLVEQQIDIDSHLLTLIKQRFDQGASSDREVAQSEALVEQARATIPVLRIDLFAQLNRLDVLMGAQPGTYAAELTAVPAQLPDVPAIRGDLQPAEWLRRRPDVIAAERRIAATNARIGVAVSDYYPKLSLAGLLGFESLGSNQMISAAAFQPTIIAGLRWRLFDFGMVDAEVAQAKGANAEALAHYRQAVFRAAEDVEDAFTSVVEYENQSREISEEVASLYRANKTTEEAYEAGSISLTDVLDTERQILLAQDEGVRSRVNALRASAFSFRAMGGGWQ